MLLLDTNAILFVAYGEAISSAGRSAIADAAAADDLFVSAVSGWELGLLFSKRKIDLTMEPAVWFDTFLARSTARVLPLSLRAALASSFLPGGFHGDPADRMLVATARELGAVLVTRDRKILDYAQAGHLRALPC